MNKDNYIELPREKITFYGDTENEKKANELLFDMGLELSALDDEIKEKDKEIDRLNNIITELEKDIDNQLTMTRKLDKYNEGFFKATLHFYDKLKALKENNK